MLQTILTEGRRDRGEVNQVENPPLPSSSATKTNMLVSMKRRDFHAEARRTRRQDLISAFSAPPRENFLQLWFPAAQPLFLSASLGKRPHSYI